MVPGAREMACHDFGLVLHVTGKVGQEHARDALVIALARGAQQGLVRCHLHENVLEHERLRVARGGLPGETGGDDALQILAERLLGPFAHRAEKRVRELAADRCRELRGRARAHPADRFAP